MQIPGVNYTKKFAPVANDGTTRAINPVTLKYKDKGWKCQTVDVEATSL